jgi:hypothetical protein
MALVVTGLFAGAIGCKKEVDHAPLLAAINKSLVGRHDCIWPEPIKLPMLVDPTQDARIRGFDALTDAGLFIRENVIKTEGKGQAKQMFRYNLSDKGHPSWTADPKQPGYGNFCFGRSNATAIDSAKPNDSANPTQYTVQYQYEVLGIPEWVRTPESMRAFPKLAADTSIQTATATLVKGESGGWEVAPASAP